MCGGTFPEEGGRCPYCGKELTVKNMPRCPLCYGYPFEGKRCPICGYPATLKRGPSNPNFPIETYPEKQKQRIIGWIEAEGSFLPMLSRMELIEDYQLPPEERVYKHNYLRPFFSLEMTDRIPVEIIREAFDMIGVYEYTRPKPPYKKVYATHKMHGILDMAQWILPELTPNTTRYTQVKSMLTIFSKEEPTVKLTKEQARIIYPIRREERWETLIEWKKRGELHYARKIER